MGSVFLPAEAAHSVLRRLRRANFLLEEMKPGNIQRECREEVCTYEEAREAFENEEKTKRFWEEYVRESSPAGGLETMVGGVHSLYLIVPLLLLLLIMAAVAVSVWRCHSLKRAQPRSPGLGPPHHGHVLSVVSSERWGRDYQHADPAELSVHSSPAWPASEGGPGRGGDPPPSYEEAVGHGDVLVETEPPPQYEDIVNSSASRGGHRK
ncbi:transmembrane gamma-carboxyglutamic acid protein 1 [Menidia menidia]